MTHNFDYDYFVIGAGSGGVRSARIAAGYGAKVGIAESSALGGTCVNLGCVPKKLFSYGASYHNHFEDAKRFGWNAENITFNWPTLCDNKTREIKRLNGIYDRMLKNAGVGLLRGTAKFIDDHTLDIDGKTITADKILIATGGKPRRPTFPGAEHVIVSDDVFYLNELPQTAIIQGGGYIAVEFAHILHGLGVDVTLMYRGDQFLRGFDSDIRNFLADEYTKQGIKLLFNTDITRVTKNDAGFDAETNTEGTLKTDLVFSAIGREANTKALALDKAGVNALPNGRIETNGHYRTNIPHIYAVGDITNNHNLTPVAIAEGHSLADNLFGGKNRIIDYKHIATAVFSHPQIGTVGLSEDDARTQGLEITVFKTSFKPMRHTLSERDEKIFMKLVVCKASNTVLGVHMVGENAPEIIQPMAIAMKAGATKADFDATMPVHPTASEEFVTMREAFEG